MSKIDPFDDTIAAISTATGQGAIGIVRLSGKDALSIADKMFVSRSGEKPSQVKSFSVHYGNVVRTNDGKEELIDEALLTVMKTPKTYTTEDIAEISSHGGMVSLRSILDLALDLGARLAEPGEFTKRAFLNGRIDLAQAEAVLDIIQSKTNAFLRVSTNQLKGELSKELYDIREALMSIYAEMEVEINFSEEEIGVNERQGQMSKIASAMNRISKLLSLSGHGRILKEGIKIVICGKPNVGKSSLLNALLRTQRAIISDIAGTTRDTIEETSQIKGIPFKFVDTAGILDPRDEIEKEAVRRSHMNIDSADIVLLVLDSSRSITKEDKDFIVEIKNKNRIVVLNKCDLQAQVDEKDITFIIDDAQIVKASAIENVGIGVIEDKILEKVWHGDAVETDGILVSNLRHIRALKECDRFLEGAEENLGNRLSLEFVSEEIKSAVNCLDKITGKDADSDLIEDIFSKFCIGK